MADPTLPSTFVLMSHKWNKNIFTNLASLRDDGILCDVTLQGNDNQQINAHSSVLAAASSVLKSCLVSAPRGHYVVKIPTISSRVWHLLLSFMYTGKVRITFADKLELISACQTLGLLELNGLCSAVYDTKAASANQLANDMGPGVASDSNINKGKLAPETGFGAANFTSGMSEEVTIMNEEDAEDEEVEGAIGDRTLEEALKRASAEAAAVDMDPGTDATADVTADDAALETQDDSNTAKPSKKSAQIANEIARSVLFSAEEAADGKTRYICGMCGKSFPWGRALLVHEMMHKDKKPLATKHKCSKCDKFFPTFHSLRAHERTHRYMPFRCELCNSGFHFRVNYELHRKKVHGLNTEVSFTCNLCSKQFMALGLLRRHKATVHRGESAEGEASEAAAATEPPDDTVGGQCVDCDMQFENRAELTAHFKTMHGVERRECKCSECNEVFPNVQLLKEHFVVHSGVNFVKPYQCRYCEKRFMYKFACATHEKDTHEQTPQQCTVCHATMKSEKLLAKHMKLHDGQIAHNVWKCSICEEVFNERSAFGLHMAEHRGEKTYYCKYCNKGFAHKGNYSTHMQRHLGIKPYSCQYCQKTFVRKDDMKSHLRVHTGEKPFVCKVCQMRFSGISNLREHERAKHNVSFSKRNPVITPRQHRAKFHRGSKTVTHVNLSQDGALADLADVVTGVISSSKDSPAELIIEQKLPQDGATDLLDGATARTADGTFTQLVMHVTDAGGAGAGTSVAGGYDAVTSPASMHVDPDQPYDVYDANGGLYRVVLDPAANDVKHFQDNKPFPPSDIVANEHNIAAHNVQAQAMVDNQ